MAQTRNLYKRTLQAMGSRGDGGTDPHYVPDRMAEEVLGWRRQYPALPSCPVCSTQFNPLGGLHPTFRFECDHCLCCSCHKGMKDSGRSMRCPLCRADENKSIVFERCKSCNQVGHKTRASKQCPLHVEALMGFILQQQAERDVLEEQRNRFEWRLERTQKEIDDNREYYAKDRCKFRDEIFGLKQDLAKARSHSKTKLVEENKMLRAKLDAITKLIKQ